MSEVVGLDACSVECVHPEKVALVRSNAPDQDELSVVTQVFKLLDPEKTIIEFNSKWMNAFKPEDFIRLTSKVTLAQMDFDTLLASPDAMTKLQQASDPKQLKDIPGLKLITDPKVTIEFVR